MKTLTIWMGLASPVWAQSLFPDGPGYGPASGPVAGASSDEEAVKISDGRVVIADETASVRIGEDASGSAALPPQQVIQPSQYSSSTAINGTVFPQAVLPQDTNLGFANMNQIDRVLWRINNSAMDQYGARGGYTTISPFIPLFPSDTSTFFINPRLFADDYGNGGGNIGAGYRWYVPGMDRVYGVSAWWDKIGGNSRRFNTVGMNFESIGQYLSLRGGFAQAVGDDNGVRSATLNSAPFYTGNNIAQSFTFVNDQVFDSYDIEAAIPAPLLGRYGIDTGVGAYFLDGAVRDSTAGVSARVQGQVTEDFWMNGTYTYDKIFGSQFSINMELTIPDGHPSRWFRRNPVSTALTQSVQRRYRVPVGTFNTDEDVLAECPLLGTPFRVAHIVPGAAAGGDGSIENPFGSTAEWDALTLAEKATFEIVLVDGGTGNGADLDTGITIVQNQRLLSRSVTHNLTAVFDIPDPTLQTIVLPQTGIGPTPLLQRINSLAQGEGVVIIDNRAAVLCPQITEVSGFHIDGLVNNMASDDLNAGIITADLSPLAIHLGASGVTGFNFNRNNITNTVDAINITHFGGGPGIVEDNFITGAGFQSSSGVTINHGAGTLQLLIDNNQITSVQGEDQDFDGTMDTGDITGLPGTDEDVNNNGILDPGEDLDADGVIDVYEDNNGDLVLQQGWAVNVIADGPLSTIFPAIITNNTLTSNGGGLRLEALNGATFVPTVTGNNMSTNVNPNAAGFRAIADGSTMLFLDFTDNFLNSNAGNGGEFNALNAGTIGHAIPIENNQFNGNRRNGLLMSAAGGSTLIFDIGDPTDVVDATNPNRTFSNTFNNNGTAGEDNGNGLMFLLTGGSTMSGNGFNPLQGVYNIQAQSNQGSGILFDVTDSEFDDFQIIASDLLTNAVDGIQISSESTGANLTNTNLQIVNNNINNNTLNGINFQLLNTNLEDTLIQANTINGNASATAGPTQFDIDVVFGGGLTASQQAVFALAAARWSQIITADLPDIAGIDDIQILASGVFIDGVNGILGQAGPTNLRPGTFLPYEGIMQFDTADLADMETSGLLQDVILHEMGHVLGIGTIWQNLGFLQNPSNGDGVTDTRFTGPLAAAEYLARFPADPVAGVPVHNADGAGSADSHWRESVYDTELMTPFIGGVSNPISRTTIAHLDDLGYTVNMAAADPFLKSGQVIGGINMTKFAHTNAVVGGPALVLPPGAVSLASLVVIDPTTVGAGINFSIENGDMTNVLVENNTITNNAGDGIRLLSPEFASPGVLQDITIRLNTITNNSSMGLNVSLDNDNHLQALIYNNNISNNLGGGIQVALDDSAFFTTDFAPGVDGFFANNINANGGPGFRITAEGASEFVVNMSHPVASQFLNNVDAGIAIVMAGSSVGTFTADNITITGTTDNAATLDLNGSGFDLSMIDDATLDNLRIGHATLDNTNINSNAENGIDIDIAGTTSLVNAIIQNTNINNNALDGIWIIREGAGVIDNFQIGGAGPGNGNNINNNGADGIHLHAENSNINDDYIVQENTINNNGLTGIFLEVYGDAQMNIDILFNDITNSAGDGILAVQAANDPTDERSLTGNWLGNDISDNGLNGIRVVAPYGILDGLINPLNIGANGIDGFGRGFGNDITGNALDGIILESAGYSNIVNNFISENGLSGIVLTTPGDFRVTGITDNDILNNGLHGVDIINDGGTQDVFMQRNLIRFNAGDGVQMRSTGIAALTTVTINDINVISDNGGRGIDMLMQSGGDGIVLIDNAIINGNGQEGVYAVVTSSATQTNDVAATVALLADGAIQSVAPSFLDLTLNNSVITENASAGGFFGGGVVLRVGTSNSSTIQLPGTAVWNDPNTQDPLIGGGLLIRSMDDNIINNNFGIDLYMETFVSTVDPAVTGGTWTDDNDNPRNDGNNDFNPTGYQRDPLARIMVLSMDGNVGGSASVYGSANNLAAGVTTFYQSAEDEFKSRTQNQDGNDPPNGLGQDDNGPFANNAGSRRRNATRLPFRGIVDDPFYGLLDFSGPSLQIIQGGRDSNLFRYPGIGASTLTFDDSEVDNTLSGFTTVLSNFDTLFFFSGANLSGELETFWEAF